MSYQQACTNVIMKLDCDNFPHDVKCGDFHQQDACVNAFTKKYCVSTQNCCRMTFPSFDPAAMESCLKKDGTWPLFHASGLLDRPQNARRTHRLTHVCKV